MNKNYRSIWNEALGAWVAVSEIETAKGKPVSAGAGSACKQVSSVKMALKAIPLALCMVFGSFVLPQTAQAANAQCSDSTAASGVDNTVVCGPGAVAASNRSVAIGYQSQASASGSSVSAVAVGPLSRANSASAAVGVAAEATGSGSVAFGSASLLNNTLSNNSIHTKTVASGQNSIAIGTGANARSLRSTVIGDHANISDTVVGGVALGMASVADRAAAVGGFLSSNKMTTASAAEAMPIDPVTGQEAQQGVLRDTASTAGAVSIGGYTPTAGNPAGDNYAGNVALYRQITNLAGGTADTDAVNMAQLKAAVTRYYSVNDGGTQGNNYTNNGATANKALAAGVNSSATAAKSVAVGSDSTVSGEQSVSVGSENLVAGSDTYVLGSGNHKPGANTGEKAAITANNSTVVGKGNTVAANADVHIQGNTNTVTRTHALVMGSNNTVSGSGAANEEPAIAIGSTNTVSHDNALAIGKSNTASAQSSIAVGVNSQATARSTVALGNAAKATEENGLAIGSYAEAGNYATAVGSQARAKKAHGVAVGTTSLAGERATTVGRYSAAHADSSIALGSDALVTTNAHASVALGSGSVVSGAYSGALSSSIQNNGTINGDRGIALRSVVGGTNSYAIGNKNIVGSRSGDTFILGNNVKIGATGAALATTNITQAGRTDAVTFQGEKEVTGAVALGSDTGVTVSDGVALGRNSKAATDKGVIGADPLNAVDDKNGMAWKSTKGAVAVGNAADGHTRQITGLAAGKEDTDAVNVAQLKAAGFQVTAAASGGEVAGNTVEKVQNGEMLTLDAGKNIKLTQSGKQISVATKDNVVFDSVTAGGNVFDGTAINVGGRAYTNVAEAINALAAGSATAQTHYFSVNSTDRSDESNFNNGGATGNDALAAGRKAKAGAAEAVAVGSDATASGNQSLAVGNKVSATHLGATAVGNNAKALNTGAQAFGQSSEATGENSAAIGRLAIATGDRASAFGVGNTASGISSFSGGDKAKSAGEKSIALGFESNVAATGNNAIAVGSSAVSAATNSVVIGSRASVAETGSGSVAIGAVSKANGVNATAVGQASEASGQNSFAGGQDSHATGKSSVAVGDGAKARVDSATAVGAYAHAGPEGTDEELAALLTSDKNAGAGASAFGISSKATTYRSLALGASSSASGGNSALAVGDSANASAGDAVAIGKSSAASAAQAVALGRQATANIAGGVAIGYMSKTEVDKGVAGADPLNVQANKVGNKAWTSTRAAVSVGDVEGGTTRQITGLAAGTQDTDAVNVAQLKAAGIQVATSASAGEATPVSEKLKNGETLTLDAGKNIKLSQVGSKITVATKNDVVFDSVTAGGNVLDGTAINVGGQAYTNVAAAINALAADSTTAKTHYYSVRSTERGAESNFDNNGATGENSMAAGVAAQATGASATALGHLAKAKSEKSLALGAESQVTSLKGIAIGNGAQALGGAADTTKTGNIAIGNAAQTESNDSVVIGTNAQATVSAENAVVIGKAAAANKGGGNNSVAIGKGAVVTADGSIALGEDAKATAFTTPAGISMPAAGMITAIGYKVSGSGMGSVALGSNASTTQNAIYSVAIGNGATAGSTDASGIAQAGGRYGVAVGNNAKAIADNSAAFGPSAQAQNTGSLALGHSAIASVNSGIALGANSLADVSGGMVGADPLSAVVDKNNRAWTSSALYGSVSVGSSTQGITRQITNLAAGTADTDAVNVAQLKAAGLRVATSASEGEATSVSEKLKNGETLTLDAGKNIKLSQVGGKITVATKNDVAFGSVTAGDAVLNSDGLTIAGGPSVTKTGIDAAGKKIGKVAAGRDDDDAVNMSQLKDSDNIAKGNMAALGGSYDAATDTYTAPSYTLKAADGTDKPAANTVQNALGSLNEEIEKPIAFAADKGTNSERRLGSTVSIKAGNFSGAASADNLVTESDGNGTITVKLADNPTFKGKVTAQGLDAGGQRITGVGQGEQGTDAVNVAQLQQALQDLTVENMSLVAADSPFSYVNGEGEQLIRKVNNQGKAYFVKASDGTTPYEGTDIVVSALNAVDPQTAVPTRVTNVARGVKDTDAVNTSQLKDVWTALGGSINEQGETVKPVYKITRADGSPAATVNTVGEALGHLNAVLKDPITVSGNTNNGSSTIVQGGSDQKLGSRLAVEGGLVDGTSSAANIRTVVTDGKVEIQLADAPTFAGKVSAKGLDAGNGKITGVANGTDAADAVNKSQLDAQGTGMANLVGGNTVYNPAVGTFANNNIGGTGKNNIHEAIEAVRTTAGAGWNLTAEGGNGSNVAAGDTVDLASSDKNIVISKEADSDQVVFDLADNITVSSVKAGNTTLASNGLTIGNDAASGKAPVVLNSDGLNNGGNAITNVGAGKNLTDAVNVSQLTPLATALGAAFDPVTGNVGAPVFTVPRADGSTYPAVNTVQGALDHIGTEIRKPVSFAGNTGSTERKLGETFTVKGSLADSVQASDRNIRTKVENGTMTVELAESPRFGNITVNEGGKITGIENGTVAEGGKEAVNGGQLYAQGKGVAAVIGGNTEYNPADGTFANNNIGGTGESNINDAIAAVKEKADAGWNLTAQGKNSSNVQPGETVDLANNDKNIVIGKEADSDKVVFDLADDITVNSVTAGDTVLNGQGVKVGENTALTSDGLSVKNPAKGTTVSITGAGLNNGGNVITGVGNGLVAEGSQEAVTGDQLFAVDKKVGENTAALEKGLDFAGNSGNFNRRLGERTTVKGGLDNAAAASDTNIRTVADSTGNIQILLADAPVFKGKLTAQGLDAGGQKITNVKDGENEGDAVNVSQLQRALDNQTITHQSLVQANSPFSYVNSKGEVLVRQVDGQGRESFIKVADGSAYTGKDITISSLNPLDPQTAVPTVVGNIADGKKNNDAVNVGQLKNTVAALGGGAEVKPDGSIKAPVYTVFRNDSGYTTVNNIGDALGLLNTEITKPLTFVGDNQDVKVTRTLDTELKVVGGAGGNLTDNNIGVTGSTDNNSLTVKLAEKINLGGNGSVTTGQTVLNNDGVKVGGSVALTSDGLKAGDVNITSAGIDAGNKQISGVKAGEQDNDAVNVAQLKAVTAASANKVEAGSNIEVGETKNADGSTTYIVSTAKDLAVDSVKAGGTTVNNGGVQVGGQVSLASDGLKAGNLTVGSNGKIGGLEAGSIAADSKEAVNGSQLYGTADSVAKALGGGSAVNADGTVGAPAYTIVDPSTGGSTVANNVGDALTKLNSAVNSPLTFAGDSGSSVERKLGTTVNLKGGATGNLTDNNIAVVANGTDTLSVKLAETVNLGGNGSVTTGQTVLNNDGVKVGGSVALTSDGLKAGDVNITSAGIDAGNKQISGVKAGEQDNDAVNVAQLKALTAASAGKVEAGGNIEVAKTKNADGSTTYTVSTAKEVSFNSVTAGTEANRVVLDDAGVNVGGNTYISSNGINANNQKVANVASGNVAEGSTDAVNGGQLHNTAASIANMFGGNAGVNPDGSVSMSNIGGTGANNVNDAIKAANRAAVEAKTTVSAGDNIVVAQSTNADGSTNYTVSTAKDLAVDSVKAGDTVLNGNGLSIANGPSVTVDGLDAGGKKLANVADGEISATSKEAVNGSQLHYTNEAINNVANYTVNMGNQLNRRIDDVENRSNAGTATAMAVAGLPQAYLPGKSMVAVAGGTYRGESGYAVGYSSISDNGNWIIKGSATGNSRGHYGATAGVGYQW